MIVRQEPRPQRSVLAVCCPLCGGGSRSLFAISGFDIAACSTCGHRFAVVEEGHTSVTDTYDDRYFTGGGVGYPNYLAEGELLRQHGRRYASILARYTTPGRLLDVGTAAGFILAGLCDAGWAGVGLEPNAAMARYGRTQLGMQIVQGTLKEHSIEGPFDVVTMIQVVAHFFDVTMALGVAADVTRRGGLWLIETWNRESITARILGRHWHEYSPPSVRNMFSLRGLDALVGRYGFLPVARGRPKKFVLGQHLKSILAHKAHESAISRAALWLGNRISDDARVWYPAEDLFWRLYQKT